MSEAGQLLAELMRDGASPREAVLVLAVTQEIGGAIELAHGHYNPAEMRDPRGQWTRGGVAVTRVKMSPAHRRAAASARPMTPSVARATMTRAQAGRAPGLAGPRSVRVEQADRQQSISVHAVSAAITQSNAYTEGRISEVQIRHMQLTAARVDHATAQLEEARGKEEKKKHRHKFAIHVGTLMASTLLSGVALKMEAPELAVIGSTLAPNVVMELVDWVRRL